MSKIIKHQFNNQLGKLKLILLINSLEVEHYIQDVFNNKSCSLIILNYSLQEYSAKLCFLNNLSCYKDLENIPKIQDMGGLLNTIINN
jgi:hypothetical protein